MAGNSTAGNVRGRAADGGNLEGRLLIVYGDMDENVPPAQAFRFVDALMKANKPYDLLYLPNRNHGGGAEPYALLRTWDYFVEHLLGVEPPRDVTFEVKPGIYDVHVHPVLGGTEVLLQCLFPPTAGRAEIEETLSACVAADPAAAWIEGGRWTSNFFVEHDIGSPREWLDRFSGDVAISLADDTCHNRWVNSRALELVGIDSGTVVEGDEVVLDEATGEPNGLLLEAAMYPVFQAIPDKTAEQFLRAARESIRTANRFGINPWPGMEALVTRADPWGGYPGTLAPEQAVSLEEAIELYTLAGARLLGVESRAGTIAAGKSAELIVLDRNLFDVPIEDVSDTCVEMTVYAGAIVHEK